MNYLSQAEVDPFYLDNNGLSGLDYLLMPDADGHSSGYFLANRIYLDLLVKFIELYYIHDPDDIVLQRNLQKICTDQQLFQALEERLRRKVGILLHNYCKPPIPAGDVEVMKGTYADAEGEASDSLTLAEQMEHGIAIPVSPERNFLIGQEAELYERQPMPEDFRRLREEAKNKRSGGLRKNRTKKGSKKRTKKGKSKRTRRSTKKSRKSRN
jgi:hypothetical protein